jgi:hypothetical protein
VTSPTVDDNERRRSQTNVPPRFRAALGGDERRSAAARRTAGVRRSVRKLVGEVMLLSSVLSKPRLSLWIRIGGPSLSSDVFPGGRWNEGPIQPNPIIAKQRPFKEVKILLL